MFCEVLQSFANKGFLIFKIQFESKMVTDKLELIVREALNQRNDVLIWP